MNDYDRVANIIRFMDAACAQQPDLSTLAARVGLNPFHFHRLFSRWAGITPKDFLQCLTLEHARARLRQGGSVLHAALDNGLSSPGRLHDLCVTLEAATPGEIKNGGQGWTIEAGFAETPFGIACIGQGPRGVCHLAFVENRDRAAASAPIRKMWPRARLSWNTQRARSLGDTIFCPRAESPAAGKQKPARALRAFVRGTPFQLRVWRALLHVPAGALISYGRLANSLGAPGAARAVGTAVAGNSIAFLIPCHRVIRETGVMGEYRWGRDRKRLLLAWESQNR